MMKKCSGCGAYLQTEQKEQEGYIVNKENSLCERCFRITHYNEYQVVDKDNVQFINILKDINQTNDLVVLLVDVFNIPSQIEEITNYLNNDILFVFTKKDLLPLKITDQKLLEYIRQLNIKPIDQLVVSSKKNINFDILYQKILQYKKSNQVYVVGFTNAGKSTLINKFISNYSDIESILTVSNLPSTTLHTMNIPINDELTLIDTPGILDEGNIVNVIDQKLFKKIIPKKEIKPITYQVKSKQYILIENILKIECSNNNLTFYLSNELKIERFYKDKPTSLVKRKIKVKRNQDIVITGLGFIKVGKTEVITLFIDPKVDVFVRESLI